MAPAKRDEALYVRNGRPNRVVFHFDGIRYMLEHRGNRQDSVALPAEAASDQTVSRWLRLGQLEKISKDAFMKLGARTVDVLPNEYLRRDVRSPRAYDVNMRPADADTTKSLTQVDEKDVHKAVRDHSTPKWAGDLMSTEEELEDMDFTHDHQQYPSHHRDDDVRRQMGY